MGKTIFAEKTLLFRTADQDFHRKTYFFSKELQFVTEGMSCHLGAAGAGAAESASVSDSGFVFVLLPFISFLVCM